MTFVVGNYQATELLATGAFAQVWRARRMDTGAVVALKVFPPDQLAAVRREAALAAAVDHPHVVTVLDVVADADRVALVTECAAGGDLADLLAQRGRLTPGQTLTVLIPLAAALATAHERQVVHGDISAGNIVFDEVGRPLLADLGAARAAMESGRPVQATPCDAAPELARAGAPTPATDLFSLGSVALACLTGRPAWPADDLRDVVIQAAAGQWPDLPDDAAPVRLVAAVRSLLEHDPERRPGAASLVLDLRSVGRPEPLDVMTGRRGGVLRAAPAPAGGPIADRPTGHRRHGRNDDDLAAADESPPWHGPDAAHRAGSEQPRGRRELRGATQARALTRARSDAAPGIGGARPDAAGGSDGSSRLRARITSARARASRGALRITALAVVGAVVAVVAGLVGLRWAASSQPEPLAVQQLTPSQGSPSSVPDSGAPGVATDPTRSRRATAQSGSTASAARSAGSTGVRATTTSATDRPATARGTPATAPPARSTPPAGSATPARSTPPARSTAAVTSVRPADWTATVRELDRARSKALIDRDPALLDAVYTSNSAARSADVQTIRTLVAEGLRVSGAEHRVESVQPVRGAAATILVLDSLPSYQVLDATGSVVGRTPERAASPRVMVLVDTAAGYRISEVRTA